MRDTAELLFERLMNLTNTTIHNKIQIMQSDSSIGGLMAISVVGIVIVEALLFLLKCNCYDPCLEKCRNTIQPTTYDELEEQEQGLCCNRDDFLKQSFDNAKQFLKAFLYFFMSLLLLGMIQRDTKSQSLVGLIAFLTVLDNFNEVAHFLDYLAGEPGTKYFKHEMQDEERGMATRTRGDVDNNPQSEDARTRDRSSLRKWLQQTLVGPDGQPGYHKEDALDLKVDAFFPQVADEREEPPLNVYQHVAHPGVRVWFIFLGQLTLSWVFCSSLQIKVRDQPPNYFFWALGTFLIKPAALLNSKSLGKEWSGAQWARIVCEEYRQIEDGRGSLIRDGRGKRPENTCVKIIRCIQAFVVNGLVRSALVISMPIFVMYADSSMEFVLDIVAVAFISMVDDLSDTNVRYAIGKSSGGDDENDQDFGSDIYESTQMQEMVASPASLGYNQGYTQMQPYPYGFNELQ